MLATSAAIAFQNVASESTAVHQNIEHKRKRSHQLTLPETAGTFSKPLQDYQLGQTIYQYFAALRSSLDASSFKRVEKCDLVDDGLYLHKRVISGMDQTNKGTVTHHVVVYLKEGSKLHSLDFGPDNGSDVTANIFMEHASRKVLNRDIQIPSEDDLPLMFVGHPELPLEYGLVSKAVEFAEAQMYHAMKNNCIHFADFIVRVLSRGKIRGAPMIYDIVCGDIPLQDPPESLMLAMFGMSWFTLCDGSAMTARFMASLDVPTPTLQHSVSLSDLPSKKPEVPEPVLAPSALLSSAPAPEVNQKLPEAVTTQTVEVTASALVQAATTPAVVKAPEVSEAANAPAVVESSTVLAKEPKAAKAAAATLNPHNSQNPASEQVAKVDAMAAFAAIASAVTSTLGQQAKQKKDSVAGMSGAEGMASSASTDSLASADTAHLCLNGA